MCFAVHYLSLGVVLSQCQTTTSIEPFVHSIVRAENLSPPYEPRQVWGGNLVCLYQGAMAAAAATAVGYFPWFLTFNYLNGRVRKPSAMAWMLLRNAAIGLASSVSSDVCSNSIRVLKTTKQAAAAYDAKVTYRGAAALVIDKDGILVRVVLLLGGTMSVEAVILCMHLWLPEFTPLVIYGNRGVKNYVAAFVRESILLYVPIPVHGQPNCRLKYPVIGYTWPFSVES